MLACAVIRVKRENRRLRNGVTEHWKSSAGAFRLIYLIYINVAIGDGGLGINIGDMMPDL